MKGKIIGSWKRLLVDVLVAVIIIAIAACVFEERQSYIQAQGEEGEL